MWRDNSRQISVGLVFPKKEFFAILCLNVLVSINHWCIIVAERGATWSWFPVIVPSPSTKSTFPFWHTTQYFPSGIFTFTASVRALSTTIVLSQASPHGFPFRRKATTLEAGTGINSKCSLIKAAKNVINKFEQINKTYTKITSEDRREVKMFDNISVKEAITNAFVHTLWEREYPPKFEIFNDHISISSTGGLPLHVTKEDFLRGFSAPTHPELMRIFKDLDLVEQLGTGIIRILKSYSKDIYEFSDNFIRVNFKFRTNESLFTTPRDINTNKENLSKTQENIINLIKENNQITQLEISKNLGINKTTVTRNLKKLKEKNIIKRIGDIRNGKWIIL